jgi:galactokinase
MMPKIANFYQMVLQTTNIFSNFVNIICRHKIKNRIEMDIRAINEKFKAHFGVCGEMFTSPGRINLIGEHTDYNGGFVFPGAIDKGMVAEIKLNDSDKVRAYAVDLDEYAEFCLREEDAPEASWARYIFGVCREIQKRGKVIGGFDTAFSGDVPLGAGMSSSAALESTFANALNELFALNIDRFELARIGQSTEHNYCGVKCGIMDQFASIFGKAGHLMRLDCRSMEFEYFPFDPEKHGYKVVLLDSVVKHELVGSPYNDRRASCERVAAALGQEFLRGATMAQLEAIKDKISEEDYKRARYVIGEEARVLDVCEALKRNDYDTVGKRMYETHWGMSKDYEVSCEELDFLATIAEECGVTGSRIMGGGFGGCTINLVKAELYDSFIATAKSRFNEKYGHEPKVYAVVISDGARRL